MTKADRADELIASWRREMPEVAGVALEVSKRASRLHSVLDQALGSELSRLELTRAEYGVLATLRRVGRPYRLRPSELAAALLFSSGGISNVIKRIVDAGYVRRSGDPSDGRSAWVELTPSGVELAERAVRRATAAQERSLRRVPPETVRAVADVLRDLLLALEEEPGSERSSG